MKYQIEMYKMIKRLQQLHKDVLNDWGVPLIPLRICGRTTRALGVATHIDGKPVDVVLSKQYIMHHDFDEVSGTLLHELAHVIDVHFRGHSGHDQPWQDIARAIGVPENHIGKTAYGVSVPVKYYVVCSKCGKIVAERSRKTKALTARYRSNCCSAALKFKDNPRYIK